MEAEREEAFAQLLARCHDKGIEEVELIIGEPDAAERRDIVFISPREIFELYKDDTWVRQLKNAYGWPMDELLRWSLVEESANSILGATVEVYMQNEQITKDTVVDPRNNVHNIAVQVAKGTWKAPVLKFKEATTRSELEKLNKSM